MEIVFRTALKPFIPLGAPDAVSLYNLMEHWSGGGEKSGHHDVVHLHRVELLAEQLLIVSDLSLSLGLHCFLSPSSSVSFRSTELPLYLQP